jgi:hypothetical protein
MNFKLFSFTDKNKKIEKLFEFFYFCLYFLQMKKKKKTTSKLLIFEFFLNLIKSIRLNFFIQFFLLLLFFFILFLKLIKSIIKVEIFI